MNQAILIGRISNDLDLKYLPNGQNCKINFNLAVNGVKRQDGSQETDFIPVEIWNKAAENLVKFQTKGSKIAVRGRISVDNYTDQQGNKKSFTKVVASEVEYLEQLVLHNQLKAGAYAAGNVHVCGVHLVVGGALVVDALDYVVSRAVVCADEYGVGVPRLEVVQRERVAVFRGKPRVTERNHRRVARVAEAV